MFVERGDVTADILDSMDKIINKLSVVIITHENPQNHLPGEEKESNQTKIPGYFSTSLSCFAKKAQKSLL